VRYLIPTLLLLSILVVGCKGAEKQYTYTGQIVKVVTEEEKSVQKVLFKGDVQYTSFYHTDSLEFGKCYTITSWKPDLTWENNKTHVEEIECPEL